MGKYSSKLSELVIFRGKGKTLIKVYRDKRNKTYLNVSIVNYLKPRMTDKSTFI
jgi:hypothetical protein